MVQHPGVLLKVVIHACFLGFQVETVIDTIIDEARTGEIGDGKIFGKKVQPTLCFSK